jgi:hypothetical protein
LNQSSPFPIHLTISGFTTFGEVGAIRGVEVFLTTSGGFALHRSRHSCFNGMGSAVVLVTMGFNQFGGGL